MATSDPLAVAVGNEAEREDPFDNLASWPALASFVEDMDEHATAEEQNHANEALLQRSLSMPNYLNQGAVGLNGGMRGGMRSTSFGPNLLGGAPQGFDANAEISARVMNLLAKVRVSTTNRSRPFATPARRDNRRRRPGGRARPPLHPLSPPAPLRAFAGAIRRSRRRQRLPPL